ncbi:chromobox protein homolog 1-like isoform X2 [Harmonia axyridis]|uniref:chromobox protein homolog 1-like isoform X2 n=1 Tax=Harmonia axyridis TaxID=115357 RepID=UPI001E277EF6|nr:chromobox protein homolog 1-like isoform X2 [Harmonia axyridis]
MDSEEEVIEDLATGVMSCSIECGEAGVERSSTPAEKSFPERVKDVVIDEQGNKIYLVKWFGFPEEENTWVSESHLKSISLSFSHLMDEFNKSRQAVQNQGGHSSGLQDMAAGVDFRNARRQQCPYERHQFPEAGEDFPYGGPEYPYEVIGLIENGDDYDVILKWHNKDSLEVIPRRVAKQIWPEVIMRYFEDNLVWRSSDPRRKQ